MNSFKGLIFAGCSFTWGQGLYYYSDLESLIYSDNVFIMYNLTEMQIKYMESKRFARIVANHFNSVEMVSKANGGSDKSNIMTWFDMIGKNSFHPMLDFSHIIFQLTDPNRSYATFSHKGQEIKFNFFNKTEQYYEKKYNLFLEYLEENSLTFDDWYENHVIETLNFVKEKLVYFEKNGLKSYIMTWPDVYVKHIFNDEFLNPRFINFNYENEDFNSLESLMKIPEMKIGTDFKNLNKKINDDHPSLGCHQIIAESIIKKLI